MREEQDRDALYHPCYLLWRQPLAIAIRSAGGYRDSKEAGEDRIALYADDILFFLGDMDPSLAAVMNIVEDFGRFSGLVINWEKSVLMPVDPIKKLSAISNFSIAGVVDRMKDLGIWLTGDPNQYIVDNMAPLLLRFRCKSNI